MVIVHCLRCNRYIGFRGFCCKRCHDIYYRDLKFETKDLNTSAHTKKDMTTKKKKVEKKEEVMISPRHITTALKIVGKLLPEIIKQTSLYEKERTIKKSQPRKKTKKKSNSTKKKKR